MEKINNVKIIVPSKITLTDGKSEKDIFMDSMDPQEYLKICMSIGAYEQEGILIASKV